jgi:predicted DCC family thiol-disulfide oxidoreductase YuxK
MLPKHLAVHLCLQEAGQSHEARPCHCLFDGVCHLCTSTVQWIIKRDPHGYFTFASLQSAIGRTLVAEHGLQPDALDTFVVVEGSSCFTRSDAALKVAQHLSGGWALLRVLSLIPEVTQSWKPA